MIKNLFILRENGEFLYSKTFAEGAYVDKQILLGFVMSAIHFSKETFQGIIRKIDLPIGQLVIYRDTYTKLLATCIATERDELSLVEKVLGEIVDQFVERYQSKLDSINIESTRDFDLIAKRLASAKIKQRGILEILIGIGVAFGCSIPLIILSAVVLSIPLISLFDEISYYLSLPSLGGVHSEQLLPLIFGLYSLQIFFVIFLIPIPSFLGGYFAGSKWNGAISTSAFIVTIPITCFIGVMAFSGETVIAITATFMFILSLASLPLMVIFGIVFGFLGGMLKEKNALFPT
ncbi:MAG: hypothetical protein ACTSRW_10040 [Candidatus Helarchaeota archaeon]